jgi:hypothetical protein
VTQIPYPFNGKFTRTPEQLSDPDSDALHGFVPGRMPGVAGDWQNQSA